MIFIVTAGGASAGGAGFDNDASYVLMSSTSSLNNERILTSSFGIDIFDSGSNENVFISVNTGSIMSFTQSINAEVPSGSANGVNNTFRTYNIPISGTIKVYKRGLRMQEGNDYIISASQYVIFQLGSIPTPGSNLLVDYFKEQ